jgi:hypothetical protein
MKAVAVWLVLISVEIIHGVARALWITPRFGDFVSRQIGVFSGSILIVALACMFVPWIGARTRRSLLGVGLVWLVLTVAFELGAGRFVFGRSWEYLISDYEISRGGLLPIGLAVLTFSPLIAAKLRGLGLDSGV